MRLLKKQLLLVHVVVLSIIILIWINMQNNFNTAAHKDKSTKNLNAKRKWYRCLNSIQQKIIRSFSDILDNSFLLSNPVLLVDPAYHGNIGDIMLNYGEMILMEKLSVRYRDCGIEQSLGKNRPCGNFRKFNNTLAMWQAGGNWGTLWRNVQSARLNSFKNLLEMNITILGMPQSIHYDNEEIKKYDSDFIENIIKQTIGDKKSQKHIILSWRQKNSYQEALQMYPLVDNRLVPDVAFMIGPIANTRKWTKSSIANVDLLFLLRVDYESNIKMRRKNTRTALEKYTTERNLTFRIVDWFDSETFYSANSSETVIKQLQYEAFFDYNRVFESAVAMFASAKVVITDRLHGSIFAFLSYKPHVYIDQKTEKISRTRQVAFDVSEDCYDEDALMYTQAFNLADAVNKASYFLVKYG